MVRPEEIQRLSRFAFKKGWLRISHAIDGLNRVVNSCFIPGSASVGRGTTFGYRGLGVVVHARCVIGSNCVVAQHVTLGGRNGIYEVPVVEEGVRIGAGAVVLGPVTIGRGAVIGANSVVLSNVGEGAIVAGAPARRVR